MKELKKHSLDSSRVRSENPESQNFRMFQDDGDYGPVSLPEIEIWPSGHGSSSDSDSWSDPWGSYPSDPWGGSDPGINPGTGGNTGGGGTGGSSTGGSHTGGGSSSGGSKIHLDTNGKPGISDYTKHILTNLEGYEGNIVVTSTARTPEQQARAMLNNIKKTGVEAQKKLYAPYGDMVIDVYNPLLSDTDNIRNMTDKIYEVGPEHVSKHCADLSVLNVLDVSISRLSDIDAFINALSILKVNGIVKQFFKEDKNGCIHIEIPQP